MGVQEAPQHVDPLKMRERILETLEILPANYTTVLAAMGYCGGSWNDVPVSRQLVIPKVDDCITMLLHTDNTPHNNLKRTGHTVTEQEFGMDAEESGLRQIW